MNILLVNNYYASSAPSGENLSFQKEAELLRMFGHEVTEYTCSNDEIARAGIGRQAMVGLNVPWNISSYRKMKRFLRHKHFDLVHVHNFFPLLSPSIFWALKTLNVPIAFTLHNYRLFCSAGIPMRNGQACTECLDSKSTWPAVKYGCYHDGKITSIPPATMIWFNRFIGTWSKCVDAFIALTEFQKELMVRAGLPAEKVHVKPNFYMDPPAPLPWEQRERKATFLGRLSKEKGVETLLKAWGQVKGNDVLLEIIGDGEERRKLEGIINKENLQNVVMRGKLSFEEAQSRLASSRMLIVPSLWFEGFPLVMREAFALGVPIIASDIGSIPYIVKDGHSGLLFRPGDEDGLSQKIDFLINNDDASHSMAIHARMEYETKYTKEINYETLMGIYEKALDQSRYESILSFPLTRMEIHQCIGQIENWISHGDKNRYFVCANPHSVETALKDKLFSDAIMHADLVVPDGIGIVLASRMLGGHIRERITGYDIFQGLNERLNAIGGRSCFFLGSTEDTLREITEKMKKDFPDIRVAGTYSPPFAGSFTEEQSAAMIEAVNSSSPDVLWVGMTAPKQEKWIYENIGRLDVKFAGAIGAVFDFYTGRVKRSSPVFQKMGLEWLPRFLKEPRRLWRRNLISSPMFLLHVLRSMFRRP